MLNFNPLLAYVFGRELRLSTIIIAAQLLVLLAISVAIFILKSQPLPTQIS